MSKKDIDRLVIRLVGIKPIPLNRIYVPIVKNGKPSIILSKEARENKKLIQMECIRQKQNKLLDGYLSFYMDVVVKGRKRPDIDSMLKMGFDALEGMCYKNDKSILDLRVRLHLDQGIDEVIIEIKKISG